MSDESVLKEDLVPGVFDPVAFAQAKESQAVRAAMAEWLRTFRWDYFATATWKNQVSWFTVLNIVTRWVGMKPGACAVAGVQVGPSLQKVHAHVLIGGLGRSRDVEAALRGSWIETGHVLIEAYRPSKGGVEYLLGQAEEYEVVGALIPFTARSRGRRGQRAGVRFRCSSEGS